MIAALVPATYLLLNLVAFLAFGWDKRKARRGQWRTRETTLIVLGSLGPWGAALGMDAFHHKTRKPKFWLIYLFLALHLAVVALIALGFVGASPLGSW